MSGEAVAAALRFTISLDALTVFHDGSTSRHEGQGECRRRTAGHNGLRSIAPHSAPISAACACIGTATRPGDHYVLGNYAKSEMEPLSDLLAAIASEAEWLADSDDARFMSEVALRMQQE